MQTVLTVGQSAAVIGSPVDATGNPSQAKLSNTQYTSSDPTVFTVAPDPSTPTGAIITSVGSGLNATTTSVTATLTETATATEPNGTTTEQIQGVMTVVVNAAPPPPPPVAASLVFTVGTPFITGSKK